MRPASDAVAVDELAFGGETVSGLKLAAVDTGGAVGAESLFRGADLSQGQRSSRTGWLAVHNGMPDNAGSGGEFNVSGRGLAVDDPDMWPLRATPADRYIPFEMQLSDLGSGIASVEAPTYEDLPDGVEDECDGIGAGPTAPPLRYSDRDLIPRSMRRCMAKSPNSKRTTPSKADSGCRQS